MPTDKGRLIEFPRRLEWKWVETCVGRVAGTDLHGRVEGIADDPDGRVRWQAFKGASILGWGEADDHEKGMEAARTCLEKCVVVVRPLGGDNTPGGDDDVPRGPRSLEDKEDGPKT